MIKYFTNHLLQIISDNENADGLFNDAFIFPVLRSFCVPFQINYASGGLIPLCHNNSSELSEMKPSQWDLRMQNEQKFLQLWRGKNSLFVSAMRVLHSQPHKRHQAMLNKDPLRQGFLNFLIKGLHHISVQSQGSGTVFNNKR